MKYQKTRYVLARALAAILTLTAVFGLSAPLITQAASNVSIKENQCHKWREDMEYD